MITRVRLSFIRLFCLWCESDSEEHETLALGGMAMELNDVFCRWIGLEDWRMEGQNICGTGKRL